MIRELLKLCRTFCEILFVYFFLFFYSRRVADASPVASWRPVCLVSYLRAYRCVAIYLIFVLSKASCGTFSVHAVAYSVMIEPLLSSFADAYVRIRVRDQPLRKLLLAKSSTTTAPPDYWHRRVALVVVQWPKGI